VARDPRIAFILANRVVTEVSKAFGRDDAVAATLVQRGTKVERPEFEFPWLVGAGEGVEVNCERDITAPEFGTAR